MNKMGFRIIRLLLLCCLLSTLGGCFYWWRAYETYLQMDDFDKHFSIRVADNFTVLFKDPKLLSKDFIKLAKLHPSSVEQTATGQLWHYHFHKIDAQGRMTHPEVIFSFDLAFNRDKRIQAWSFSPMFLQIAPPEFLELSFRSLGSAEINSEDRQLKVNTERMRKIDAPLPRKETILANLNGPLDIEDEAGQEIYLYHFKLETPAIEDGYEDRRLSEIKLTFDKKSQEMVKMTGRFAGLKISIDYRKYQHQAEPTTG